MKDVLKVRRLVLVEGLSQREASRLTGHSRNTISKYLKDDALPEYRRRQVPGARRLFEYEVMLRGMYEADLALPRRERRTIRGLYEALVCEGYEGSYDTVCRYIKGLKPFAGKTAKSFIPLEFDPGDALQFDWSHETVSLSGVDTKVYVAHFRLSHSRKPFVAAYLRESQEMVFDAFNRALAFYDGVPRRVIIDNASTMVSKIGKGRERDYHPRFLALMSHYVMEPDACNAASGWEKGQVENQVKFLRGQLFTPKLRFANLEDLNLHLRARCIALADRPHPEQKDRTIAAIFVDEAKQLRPLGRPFDGYVERPSRATPEGLIRYDNNRYSVPADYIRRPVSLRAYADRIVVTNGSEVLASHERSFAKGKRCFHWWHYLETLYKKPGALRDGAPFKPKHLPRPLRMIREYYDRHNQGNDTFFELMKLCQQHGREAVEMACELAVEYKTMQLSVIISLIHDLTEPSPPKEMAVEAVRRFARSAPPHPQLQLPPEANCHRYDQLLSQGEGV